MTWYCWNHWFWITILTVICALPTNSVSSYPVNSLDKEIIKEYNNNQLPLLHEKLPNELHTKISETITTDSDVVLNGEQKISTTLSVAGTATTLATLIDNRTYVQDSNLSNINSTVSNISNDTDAVTILIPRTNGSDDASVVFNLENRTSISTNKPEIMDNDDSHKSHIMQIKKSVKISTETPLIHQENFTDDTESSIIMTTQLTTNTDDNTDEMTTTNSIVTKLDLVTTYTPLINFTNADNDDEHDNFTERISTRLENVTKMIVEQQQQQQQQQDRVRKSKGLSSEYRDASPRLAAINFSTSETKSVLTRSAASDERLYVDHHDEGNVSSEALQVQGVYLMDAGTISGICFAVLAVCCGVAMAGTVLYRRRFLNKPQALSEPDSSGYIDDSTIRDNSDEMYSLDNDSFLNSLEAMTIQNYWTDTVKHTKL